MARTRSRKQRRSRRPQVLQKPRGTFHPRVQRVGPEHFGIVSVDPAKARSKWMLCDFYGKVLVPPTFVPHHRGELQAALATLRDAVQTHGLKDLLVAVERTGRYHHPIKHAFAAAGFEVRIVHPFATQQFRQASDPGQKTDDTDLAAIHRAASSGFALAEAPLDRPWRELQLLVRHRRDLVHKSSALCCQIREHLDAALPGYAACFAELWESPLALHLPRHLGSSQAIGQAGLEGLRARLRQDRVGFQERSLHRLLVWASQAPPPDVAAERHLAIALLLDDDRRQKRHEIQALEQQIAAHLTRTPYVLLLSFPGIHVVSAADFAGEMGPISHYANSRAITGRAGLYPSRYQSDQVDHPHGPLVRCANRKLRATILAIADNLLACNRHFAALAAHWKAAGKDPRKTHVKVAARFCRIAYQIVAGRQVFRHPSLPGRSYILQKLLDFQSQHQTPTAECLAQLQAATDQLPRREHAAEAAPLVRALRHTRQARRRGPQPLGQILPIVLARLGVTPVQSPESGDS